MLALSSKSFLKKVKMKKEKTKRTKKIYKKWIEMPVGVYKIVQAKKRIDTTEKYKKYWIYPEEMTGKILRSKFK